jgi:hypothetical protein
MLKKHYLKCFVTKIVKKWNAAKVIKHRPGPMGSAKGENQRSKDVAREELWERNTPLGSLPGTRTELT